MPSRCCPSCSLAVVLLVTIAISLLSPPNPALDDSSTTSRCFLFASAAVPKHPYHSNTSTGSESQSVSESFSWSESMSVSSTPSRTKETPSVSPSLDTLSSTDTISMSDSATRSPAPTRTATFSPTPSASETQTPRPTRTATDTPSPSFSDSLSITSTPSYFTFSSTATTSWSSSVSRTVSPPPTPTPTFSFSTSISTTPTSTTSKSTSISWSDTLSKTVTPGPTPTYTGRTDTGTSTFSRTASISETISPPPTPTSSFSRTATHSFSPTEGTWSRTASGTSSATSTHSVTFSDSSTVTETSSRSVSRSASISASGGTPTSSDSLPLTTSAIPPTTTIPPTPSRTRLTDCPDCLNGTCIRPPLNDPTGQYLCDCWSDNKRGFWRGGRVEGEACSECQDYFYGKECVLLCPGGKCNPCSGRGICDDGVLGTGLCQCFNDTEQGFWAGKKCDNCDAGYYGPDCKQKCLCGNHGDCFSGITGNGSCACHQGFNGPKCDVCDKGRWGIDCLECPGGTENPCSGNGVCNITGHCRCKPFYKGAMCEQPCPECNCLNGECISCYLNCSHHGDCDDFTGICSCHYGYVGRGCVYQCPKNLAGRVCSDHGTCVDGFCKCAASDTEGYWTGSLCDSCAVPYSGVNCTKRCPIDNATGLVCGSPTRGTCKEGKCECTSAFCGTLCEISSANCGACPAGYYGASCELKCDCHKGTCSQGRDGDGTCNCYKGYAGAHCEIICDGGFNNPCSNHGDCIKETGRCACHVGWGTTNCGSHCVGILPTEGGVACHNHGNCSDGATGTGRCSCEYGWTGVTTGCKFRCPCEDHGFCSDTGECTCDEGWTGLLCDRCRSGRSGADCKTPCVNGTTVGTECVCDPNFGGAECAVQCGFSEGKLCNNQGVCDDGNLRTGLCKCNATWSGPSCNCTDNLCGEAPFNLLHGQCNRTTGHCICQLRWAGPTCTDCHVSRWGPECTEVCGCANGYCNRWTGICTCYDSDALGHWKGALCGDCETGFFGKHCSQRSIINTQVAPLLLNTRGRQQKGDSIVTDAQYDSVLVGGTRLTRFFGTAQTLPTAVSNRSAFYAETFPPGKHQGCSDSLMSFILDNKVWYMFHCPLIRHDYRFIAYDLAPANSTTIRNAHIIGLNESNPRSVDTHWFGLTPAVRMATFSPPHNVKVYIMSLYFLRYPDGRSRPPVPTVCIIMRRKVSVVTSYVEVACFNPREPKEKGYEMVTERNSLVFRLSNTMVSVTAAEYSPVLDALLVFGANDRAICLGYVVTMHDGRSRAILDETFRVEAGNCRRVETLLDIHDTLLLSMVVSGKPRLIQFQYFVNGTRLPTTAAEHPWSLVPGENTAFSAMESVLQMVYDNTSQLVYLVSNDNSLLTSKFVKLLTLASPAWQLQVAGSQELNVQSTGSDGFTPIDKRIAAFAISPEQRIAFLLQHVGDGVNVRRFAIYEAISTTPVIASRSGGTELTIKGRGFARVPGANASCMIGNNNAIPATVLNSTTLTCVVPPSSASSVCIDDVVEVAMFLKVFTSSKIGLPRYPEPFLASVTPATQQFDRTMPVQVRGTGMLKSSRTLCQFRFSNASLLDASGQLRIIPLPITTKGEVLSPELVVCAPPQLTSAQTARLHISMDGSVFTPASLEVVFVGEVRAISAYPRNIQLEAAVHVPIQTLNVSFLDNSFTPVGRFFTAPVDVRVAVSSWFPRNPNASVPVLHGDDPVDQRDGHAGFPYFYFDRPRTGILNLTFSSWHVAAGIVSTWTTTATVSIIAGKIAILSITGQPGPLVDDRLENLPIIEVTDSADNLISEAAAKTLSVLSSIEERVQKGILIPPHMQLTPRELLLRFPNTTMSFRESVLTIGTVEQIAARGGFEYQLHFEINVGADLSLSGRPEVLSAWSNVMLPTCTPGHYRGIGLSACSECMAHADCTGNFTIEVNPGYWRSSFYSAAVLQCEPSFSCLGGNNSGCALGYSGPLCAVCEPGYGKSIGANCVPCTHTGLSVGLFALLTLGVLFGLAFSVALAAQNWKRNSQTVVMCMLLVTQMQTMSQVGSLDAGYPDFFRYVISWISAFFDTRLLDVSFADCLMRKDGTDFLTKFSVYSLTPLVALSVAGITWLILFLFPNLFKLSEAYEPADSHVRKWKRRLRKKSEVEAQGGRGNLTEEEWNMMILADEGRYHSTMNDVIHQKEEDDREGDTKGELSIGSYKFLAITAIQVTLFFTLPSTITYTMHMFHCLEIEDGLGDSASYLYKDMSISCNTGTYKTFRTLAVVSLLLNLLLLPFLFLAAYYIHSKLRPRMKIQRKQMFSFLLQGMRPGAWYWPAVLYVRKALLAVIVVSLSNPVDTYLSTWLLVLYLPALHVVKPYAVRRHVYLEGIGVAADLLALNMALMIRLFDDHRVKHAIAGCALLVMFLVVVVYFYFSVKRVRDFMTRLLRKEVLNNLTESDGETDSNDDREADANAANPADNHGSPGDDRSSVNDAVLTFPEAPRDKATHASHGVLDTLAQQRQEGVKGSTPAHHTGGKKVSPPTRRAPAFAEVDDDLSSSDNPSPATKKKGFKEESSTVYIPKPLPDDQRHIISYLTPSEREVYLADPSRPLPTQLLREAGGKPQGSSHGQMDWVGGEGDVEMATLSRSGVDEAQRSSGVAAEDPATAGAAAMRRTVTHMTLAADDDLFASSSQHARRTVLRGGTRRSADLTTLAGIPKEGTGTFEASTPPRRNQRPPPLVVAPRSRHSQYPSSTERRGEHDVGDDILDEL